MEGIHHVGQAAAAGALDAVFYAPELLSSSFAHELIEEQLKNGVPCHAVSAEVFTTLAERANPQGIVGVARSTTTELNALSKDCLSWGVALVVPQDPGNVGTILRTIDAVGASGLILLDDNVDPHHPRCVRASMGTLFWVPVVETTFDTFSNWVRSQGYHVYGTSVHAESDYRHVQHYLRPAILLLGSEREGLSPEQEALCETVVSIPMEGRASSLNLSVAAGVMLYAMFDSMKQPGQQSRPSA